MELNALIPTFIVGSLLLLAFLKLRNVIEVNRKANSYFGVFVLLWATFWLDEMLFAESLEDNPYIFVPLRFLQFLTPVAFFLSIIFYAKPNYRYQTRDLKYLAAPLAFLLFLVCRPFIGQHEFSRLYGIFVLTHALFYTVGAHLKIRKHQKDIELFSSSKEAIDLNWLQHIIYAIIGAAVLITFYNALSTATSLNIYVNVFFLGVVYWVAFHSIRQREIFPQGLDAEKIVNTPAGPPGNGTKQKLLPDKELARVQQELTHLMETEKPYLDSELNLVKLADALDVSGHQLSYAINTGFGENFFYFTNKYRVQRAQELLTDPAYAHLTILAIGFESGFNSKTAFNTTFKKITGHTPSEYRKNTFQLANKNT